jgi:hypothetical protein
MTKLATRKDEIESLEGFKILIYDGFGNLADLDLQGLPPYGYGKKASGSTTVIAWKNRFHQSYPGYTCDVLDKNGNIAHGNTLLKNIR